MSDDLVKRLRVANSYRAPDFSIPCIEPIKTQAADRIEELEAKLAKIEQIMVRRIKFAEQSKKSAGSEGSKRREHYRMHALSEALGEIRKELKVECDE